MLGVGQPLKWTPDRQGLRVELPQTRPGDHAYVLKIIKSYREFADGHQDSDFKRTDDATGLAANPAHMIPFNVSRHIPICTKEGVQSTREGRNK
jgi:hypothetical protein